MSVAQSTEVRIVGVEVSPRVEDIGAVASKALPPGRRYRYSVKVEYKLESGESISSQIIGLTKPKLQQRIALTKNNIALNSMFAQQYDFGDGPYWSFITKYYIGRR